MSQFNIGFVLFPRLTQLDLTGPVGILSRLPDARIHIVAKSLKPVEADCGLSLVPNASFDDCAPLDMICVPGGMGVPDVLGDRATVDFVCQQGGAAQYVSSVCTGAFILGVAGLLRGKRATTHWAYTDLLTETGAVYEPGRVVRDGNLFTGGGVTAGIDFALTVASEIAGPDVAQAIQLSAEYDPQPPFNAGHPGTAPAAVVDRLRPVFTQRMDSYLAALRQALDSVQ